MRANFFNAAVVLSDSDLVARTRALAGKEREATAELVAHLAVLEMRPSAYAALGHGTLFGYCTEALGLSEDAACTRIAAARWCRRFPVIADLMAEGTVSLTTVRLIGPHLTAENHESVLAKAAGKGCTEVKELVAALAPETDVTASVRKLPIPRGDAATSGGSASDDRPDQETLWNHGAVGMSPAIGLAGTSRMAESPGSSSEPTISTLGESSAVESPAVEPSAVAAPVSSVRQRPVVRPSAPDRYRVQFTIGRQAYDELRQVQALLRHDIRDGDPGLIFERALHLLLEQVEKAKLGKRARAVRRVIRFETDKAGAETERTTAERETTPASIEAGRDEARGASPTCGATRKADSRHVPAAVRAAVWERDGGQCAFASRAGQRCSERAFLEFHHLLPYARGGTATVDNIALRCRRHNQYEGELDFGPRPVQGATGMG